MFEGGKSESQRRQLLVAGSLLQTGPEGLAGLQQRGETADWPTAGQVGHYPT